MPKGERLRIPLDKLDVSVPEHLAPEGVCRLIMNLCPLGPAGQDFSVGSGHYWSPVESPTTRTAGGYLGFGRQTRNQHGPLSDLSGDAGQTLERIIGITDDEIKIIDPGQVTGDSWKEKAIYVYDDIDPDRRAQFAQLGESVFIAGVRPSSGALRSIDQGDPELLLEVTDDEVLPLIPPPLPFISAATSAVTAGSDGLADGPYLYRFGYILKDGTRLAAERPILILPASTTNKVTFTVEDGYREALSDEWLEKIKGIAIYMTSGPLGTAVNIEMADKWMREPYYEIGTIGLTVADTLVFADDAANITSFDVFDEATIGHAVEAGAVFAYNGRMWLGDVAYDYRAPEAMMLVTSIDRTDFPPTASDQIRFGVTIKTDKGTFERIGEPASLTTTNPIVLVGFGSVMYTDRRATKISVYISTDTGASWYLTKEYTLREAPNNNIAFVFPGSLSFDGTVSIGSMPDPADTNATRDRDVNRFLISGVLRPRELSFAREYQASNDPTDVIVGFATNALPIDQGQYGVYPVYALCTESIRLVEIDASGLPQRIVPFTTLHHCVSRYGFTNAGRTIAFVARSGIYVLPVGAAEPVRISEPLHYNTITQLDFFQCLGVDVAVGFHADLARGREEIWVAAGVLTFAYSIRHNRWFIMDRERLAFLDFSGRLLGIDDEADGIVLEESEDHIEIAYEVRTARTGLGALGYWKRLHQFTVRQRVQMNELDWSILDINPEDGEQVTRANGTIDLGDRDSLTLASAMVLEPSITLKGKGLPGQAIEYIELLGEARALHRPPETIAAPQTTSATALTIRGTPFTCTQGVIPPPVPATSLLSVIWAGFGANDECLAFNRETGAEALNNPIAVDADPIRACDVDSLLDPSYVYYSTLESGNQSFLNRRLIDKSEPAEVNLVNVTFASGSPVGDVAIDKIQRIIWLSKVNSLIRVPIAVPWVAENLNTVVDVTFLFDQHNVLAPDELGARLFYGREEDNANASAAIYRINSGPPYNNTLIASQATIDQIPGISTGEELFGLVYVPKVLSLENNDYLFGLNDGGDCFRMKSNGTEGVLIVKNNEWDSLGIGQSRSGVWSCIRYHEGENNLWLLAGRLATVKRMLVMNLDGTGQAFRISRTAPSDEYDGFGFGSAIVS